MMLVGDVSCVGGVRCMCAVRLDSVGDTFVCSVDAMCRVVSRARWPVKCHHSTGLYYTAMCSTIRVMVCVTAGECTTER